MKVSATRSVGLRPRTMHKPINGTLHTQSTVLRLHFLAEAEGRVLSNPYRRRPYKLSSQCALKTINETAAARIKPAAADGMNFARSRCVITPCQSPAEWVKSTGLCPVCKIATAASAAVLQCIGDTAGAAASLLGRLSCRPAAWGTAFHRKMAALGAQSSVLSQVRLHAHASFFVPLCETW
jgi:hypothetical protein